MKLPPGEALRRRRARRRRWKLIRQHGITPEERDVMIAERDGRCDICGERPVSPLPTQNQLHVDHDHNTGKIRGLLCSRCNRAIGALGDSVEGLLRAITYLKQAEA